MSSPGGLDRPSHRKAWPLKRGETRRLKAGIIIALHTLAILQELAEQHGHWNVLEVDGDAITWEACRTPGWAPMEPYSIANDPKAAVQELEGIVRRSEPDLIVQHINLAVGRKSITLDGE